MPLIDKSYFTGKDRLIPNLTNTHVEAALNAFIATYEPRFLKTLFGATLYTSYAAGILLTPIADEWTALQNGNVKEAFANYVYYWWMRKERTKSTSEGESRPAVENGQIVFSNEKMIDCWNRIWPLVSAFANEMDTQTYTGWAYGYKFFLFQQFRPINDFGI